MANYTITVRFTPEEEADGSYKSNFAMTEGGLGESASTLASASNAGADSIFSFLSKGVTAFATMAIVKEVVKVGQQIFNYEIQRVGRYTGSRQAQDVANATLSLLSKIKNPVESAIAYSYEKEQREYERTWESIGLQLYKERGGVSLNRSRTDR